MGEKRDTILEDVVRDLRSLPSIAEERAPSERVDRMLLSDEERAALPFTKDRYVVKENPQLVQWEREVRKFLRRLSLSGNRVSAVMIYEWATGRNVAGMMAEGNHEYKTDLRKINQVLRHHFGKPYQTWIMGRKVPNAYRVPKGWQLKYHKPMTMTLYYEYANGVLDD